MRLRAAHSFNPLFDHSSGIACEFGESQGSFGGVYGEDRSMVFDGLHVHLFTSASLS